MWSKTAVPGWRVCDSSLIAPNGRSRSICMWSKTAVPGWRVCNSSLIAHHSSFQTAVPGASACGLKRPYPVGEYAIHHSSLQTAVPRSICVWSETAVPDWRACNSSFIIHHSSLIAPNGRTRLASEQFITHHSSLQTAVPGASACGLNSRTLLASRRFIIHHSKRPYPKHLRVV